MVNRSLSPSVLRAWKRGKSILLLGPRQTGKTTLSHEFDFDLTLSFLSVTIRQAYERNPDLIFREVAALKKRTGVRICVDEVQKVPEIMDPIQQLIDQKKAQFFITGSSARKLKQQADLNLLPGRVLSFRLDGFSVAEMMQSEEGVIDSETFLNNLLHYGSLPEIFLTPDPHDKEAYLHSYVETYLEEEIRKEAGLKKLPDFYRFLEHSASQAGRICSYSGIAQDVGVSHVTVKSYYGILESTLIADRINPIIQSATRKKLIRSPRYLFFDLGVRRVAAREGAPLSRTELGNVFEQFVGLEILKTIRTKQSLSSLHFWQDPEVAEVDWVIKRNSSYLPIEVKLNSKVSLSDCKHLQKFLEEYPCPRGAVLIFSGLNPIQLTDQIVAMPWERLGEVLEKWI
ncbi:AAA family ATPase [Bdellovibrionota bacterium FG-1]